ncbi:hypothetical protein B005_2115 [Nocardiopsis alba ATCC BAA-2165]|uniref:Uncharacterized protein n=1 Tax=Nocardiopsis alba (strain ATCC BAA-2165 / BE74) TaxID=1205910 RepID=J7LCY8_NOCAA|nr:hypothetical protein B005_2115 [Nocardiopsis alba ATCC BAA-2165]
MITDRRMGMLWREHRPIGYREIYRMKATHESAWCPGL